MKTKILLTLCVFFVSLSSFSADYQTGIGFRGGLYNGLTIKHFVSYNAAYEVLVTSRWKGVKITGLYEIHNQLPGIDRLHVFYGIGAHAGFWNGDNTNWGNSGTQYTAFGIDGIIGLEYNFRELPINLSLDWKPEYNFVGNTGFWYDGGAFSIRYIF